MKSAYILLTHVHLYIIYSNIQRNQKKDLSC